MVAVALRNWLGLGGRSIVAGAATAPVRVLRGPDHSAMGAMSYPPSGDMPVWPTERLAITDMLWGDGYHFPGGELETLRLAKPLGLSSASTLLLVDGGAGGAACSLAEQLGVVVNGFEADADLQRAAAQRVANHKLAKRVQIESWDPANPAFPRHTCHHCLAVEPLRNGKPEPTLAAMTEAIKPGGQLTTVELVADAPLDLNDPVVARWSALERRNPAYLPSEVTVTRVLGRLGLDVRLVENISRRHMDQALLGWRTQIRTMADIDRPDARQAAQLINEAELWLMRLRLFREGRLRMVRWHAATRGG